MIREQRQIKKETSSERFSGVDGCKVGWLIVEVDKDGIFITEKVVGDFTGVVINTEQSRLTLIDIPIGLNSDSKAERSCDVTTRSMLGPRRSSLFPVPVRQAVHATSYEQACQYNREIRGVSLSRQSWAICSKIAEVDDIMTRQPTLQERIKESHPEICFSALNDWHPMGLSKKLEAGRKDRLNLLCRYSKNAEEFFIKISNNYTRRQVALDDMLDAMVLAISAKEAWFNSIPSLPLHPERGCQRIKMEMVVPNCAFNRGTYEK